MITIRTERPVDEAAREALLDVAYGDIRHTKPSAKLRRGRLPAEGLALVALERGKMLGTVRLWNVRAGGRDALLLGPLAVHPGARNRGIGAALMKRALGEAARRGHGAVILVGDADYYGRFGFSVAKTGALHLAAACDPARLLACELKAGALDGAIGAFRATGRRIPLPALAGLGALARRPRLIPRAA
ncbi:MAG: GNAT family N-acetyltransferase [Xanthobacteraceae bacterium]|uniref:GNAT family N-acetyltransferase n=1 Tax=Pseudolabrys sp. TaxID=1960880 RepID=UPI003D147430